MYTSSGNRGKLAAVALDKGRVMKHAIWQLAVLRFCSSLAFDGSVLVSDGYDARAGLVFFFGGAKGEGPEGLSVG